MFGVFHKNEFKGLWYNQKSDQGWLNRTCLSLGWNSLDVEAYWYNYNFDARTVYIFDEDKNLLIQGELEGGWGTVETIVGEKY